MQWGRTGPRADSPEKRAGRRPESGRRPASIVGRVAERGDQGTGGF